MRIIDIIYIPAILAYVLCGLDLLMNSCYAFKLFSRYVPVLRS